MQGGAVVLVEDDLGDAGAVAHVDEDEVAEVAAAVHPAHEDDARAGVGGAQSPAGVRAPKIAEEVEGHGRASVGGRRIIEEKQKLTTKDTKGTRREPRANQS